MLSLWCKAWYIIIIFLSFGPFTWVPLLSILRMVQSTLQREFPWCFYFWWDAAGELGFEKLSCSSEVLLYCFFFRLGFFYGVRFHYSQVLIVFSFLQASRFFPGSEVLFLLLFIISPFFHFNQSIFFYAKFHCYILGKYSKSLYQSLRYFFIFGKLLDAVQVVIL